MNASQSQNTLSERHKLSQSFSTSSLPSPPRVNDPAYNSLSGVEHLTGKGQLFHDLNRFQQYCSQDSVQSADSSVTDRKQRSDDGDSFEGDSELTADDSRAVSEGEQEESFRQYDGSGEDKGTFQLSMTIKELIDTERVYVRDLRDVVFVSMEFLCGRS
jgi:hypothetical protein